MLQSMKCMEALTHAILLQRISEVRFFAFFALPALGIAVTLQTPTCFLIAGTTVARTPFASVATYQRITIEPYITTFHPNQN